MDNQIPGNHEETRRQRKFRRVRIALWILQVAELIISIILMGLTISSRQGILDDLHLGSVPSKLSYNIAIVRSASN
jgi:hypothetical protein